MRTTEIPGLHDRVYLGLEREPRYRVLLYDKSDTISNIVLDKATQVPFDLTDYVQDITITEAEGEASTADLKIITDETISPYLFCGRPIIKIYYADEKTITENQTEYIPLFTGPAVGQPGFRKHRTGQWVITVKCIDRSFFSNKKKTDTPNYPTGTDLGDIALDIATSSTFGMGLQREECRFGLFRETVEHTTVSIYDVLCMEGLQFLGFVIGDRLRPAFDSQGFLVFRKTSLDRPPARKYYNDDQLEAIVWPQNSTQFYNRVLVRGLENNLTKVVSPDQVLVTLTGTIGYFQNGWRQRIYFSEDKTQRAEELWISKEIINGNLDKFISGKAYIKDEQPKTAVLWVKSPYQEWILIGFCYAYIVIIAVAYNYANTWVEFALEVVAAIFLAVGLLAMMQVGNFEVSVSGKPYKFVYKEIVGRATWENLEPEEVRKLEIENHLVHSQELADSLAFRELMWERVRANTRSLPMAFDPFLEVADIIEFADGTRYIIQRIMKTLKRNESANMEIEAYMFRSGNEFNQLTGYSVY